MEAIVIITGVNEDGIPVESMTTMFFEGDGFGFNIFTRLLSLPEVDGTPGVFQYNMVLN